MTETVKGLSSFLTLFFGVRGAPHHMACVILILWPGIKRRPLAVRTQSHWTRREFPLTLFLCSYINYLGKVRIVGCVGCKEVVNKLISLALLDGHMLLLANTLCSSCFFFVFSFSEFLFLKIWNASQICVSSLRRGHANLLCIVPILVYVLLKRARSSCLQVQFGSVQSLSHVQLFVTPWNVAYQAPQSMGFSRQEHWSGLPFPSPGDLPDPGIEPGSPAL